MRTVIKIGGTLLDCAESRQHLAREIGSAIRDGLKAVVVHGGGKQLTRFLAERDVESHFVNGLRVTTPEVLDAVLKVLGGSVNQELVAAFVASGIPAVGLTGMDALVTEARQMSESLGLVGQPVASNARLLETLVENGYLPVVACVAGDRDGRFYNVNADQMAASIAGAFAAQKLIFLTDVDGVRGADSRIQAEISMGDSLSLIEQGIASGGMEAKLKAAATALRAGAKEVVIAPGAVEGIVARLIRGERIGTRMTLEIGVSNHG